MTTNQIPLAQEIGRVPSMVVPLDSREERRFKVLEEEVVEIHWPWWRGGDRRLTMSSG